MATAAKGAGTISVKSDHTISGTIAVTGMDVAMAHVHEAPAGKKNGPPILTLEKGADGAWSLPAGSKLTDGQYKSLKAGNLYLNVHGAKHMDGEIRGPIK